LSFVGHKIAAFLMKNITVSDDAAITATIIAMAHSLMLRVIAAVVDSNDQYTFLF